MRPHSLSSVPLRVPPVPPCLLAILAVIGCGPSAPPITGKEWVVVAVGDQIAPVGAGGRYLTMHFDAEGSRVSGFSGCNQYNASYTLTGDSIAFGPAISTKMACLGGMEEEARFLAAIPGVSRWQSSDSTLVLHGGAGVAIRLREGHN